MKMNIKKGGKYLNETLKDYTEKRGESDCLKLEDE